MLYFYNGVRPIVCYQVWKEVPQQQRKSLSSFGSPLKERLAAARAILKIATEIRRQRPEVLL